MRRRMEERVGRIIFIPLYHNHTCARVSAPNSALRANKFRSPQDNEAGATQWQCRWCGSGGGGGSSNGGGSLRRIGLGWVRLVAAVMA